MDQEDDAFPVLFGRVSVRFELDRLPEVLDGEFEDVLLWELVGPIEVLEWFFIIQSVVSFRRLLLFGILDEGCVYVGVVHGAELALSWAEEGIRVFGADFSRLRPCVLG